VCQNGFDDNDAATACKQMGYYTGYAMYRWHTTDGSGVVGISNLGCTTHSRLEDCGKTWWNNTGCGHSYDVGVQCKLSSV